MISVHEHHYVRIVLSRHAHAETTVTMVLAGCLRERVGGREEIARPLSIVVKPRDTEHANEFGDGVRTVQIVVPADAVAQVELANAGLRRWQWLHGGGAVRPFLRLLRGHRRRGAGLATPEQVESLAYEALAALDAAGVASPSAEPPHWLAAVRGKLDDADREPVLRLAAAADVHPVYLARQFRRWYGCSISEYRGRRRVQHAAASIARADHTLSFVAHEEGFADHPHMCRDFARATGMTPSAYRKLVANEPAGPIEDR